MRAYIIFTWFYKRDVIQIDENFCSGLCLCICIHMNYDKPCHTK